ncbi:hypothetical protein CYMTET_27194 [Cymbomonas tetramitiformis]|uniref:Uncharacterized protein n=1 Tax=Cymbomonas tetramitiformis TaxID=36881 RepID=A0AAE0FQ93_9CHLO|nr:hypothetical protein CYMTET_27194 [Cymbomonas tetramitiformis]
MLPSVALLHLAFAALCANANGCETFWCRFTRTLGVFAEEIMKGDEEFNHDKCTKIRAENARSLDVGVEDITYLDDRWALMSSDDRVQLWETRDGVSTTPNGHILIFDHVNVASWPLELRNFPEDAAFHPHGIFIREEQTARKLFVVNHAYSKGGERIDVFNITTKGVERPRHLNWEYFIAPMIFQEEAMGVLNDLAVVSPSEFFVTQYHPLPDSVNGRGQNSLFTSLINNEATYLFTQLRPQHTTVVYYCSFASKEGRLQAPTKCHVAAENFAMANGITMDKDGKIYVVDLTLKSIWVYSRTF